MKGALVVLCVMVVQALNGVSAESTCTLKPLLDEKLCKGWITLKTDCHSELDRQVKEEIGASLKYLSMAGHYSRDLINRPGFAKLFFEAASEEREHAITLIEYLTMRGENADDVPDFRNLPTNWVAPNVTTGESGLLNALKMETDVTSSIVQVIEHCGNSENCKLVDGCPPKLSADFHLTDYLSHDFLDEQYKGQKVLANHLVTLNKMNQNHLAMGEFLFDKKLLLGE